MEYKLVLGLEIHLHVKTKNKMFCRCDATIYGSEPNTHTCPTCLGLPGALPVPNLEAVQKAQLLGLALGCTLNKESRFDRKHYFYPDLPKGYQISQYKQPLCEDGSLKLDSGNIAWLERIHLEEDVAKSVHEGDKTLIDFNKSGMPLIEIVTKPTFVTPDDAVDFCKKVQDVVRVLGVSDADMEKGQMRLEANVSMLTLEMEKAGELPKYKVEVKNINSFRFMEKAVKYEMQRQTNLLDAGTMPMQENRGWDEDLGQTVSQREKEEAHDYRYFPEPDIPPMEFDATYFEKLKGLLVELPWQLEVKLVSKYDLNELSAKQMSLPENSAILEKFKQLVDMGLDAKKVSNLLLNKKEYTELDTVAFAKKFNNEHAKTSDVLFVKTAVEKVISSNPAVVDAYKKGKVSSIEFLVGQVMRETKGEAKPEVVREVLIKLLIL